MADNEEFSEGRARDVAEHAREAEWRQPSFGKELFLGRLRLDLVHPHPTGSPKTAERGEAFLAKLREFCESQIDAAVIERDAQIPDKVILGLKELGAFGMKIGTEYGGLGLSQVYYNKALGLVCSVHPALGALLSAHQSIGVPQPIKLFGTLSRRRSTCRGAPRRDLAHSPSPSPTSAPTPRGCRPPPTPDGDDYVLNGVKLWSTNGIIAKLLVVMAKVPKSEDHQGSAHSWSRPMAGHQGGAPQCVHGAARHRERRHRLQQRAGAGGEPDRRRRRRPQDRAHHAQRRPPLAPRRASVRRNGA